MVLRLNGGGDGSGALGGALVFGGATSGENMNPRAYAFRFNPYCFTRWRLTSRIWTSTTTSARGLSFDRMMRSMMSATWAVARTVIVLAVLFAMITGATGICGTRMMVVTICDSSCASA